MTKQEQMLNWDAIMESGSMTAIHNIREYIKELERDRADLISIRNARAKCNCEDKDNIAKAKGIIQSFVWWHTGEDRGSIDSNDLVERAEQLLSSLE